MLNVLRESETRPPRCALEEQYGAALVLDPARVAVNFVSTIDGVVSLGLDRDDSRAVGGGVAADRLLMAMLRAEAGVIVVGAGTLRATLTHQWTAEAVLPGAHADLARLRAVAGRPADPAPLLVVSSSGHVPVAAQAVSEPAVPVQVLTAAGVTAPADAVAAGAPGPIDAALIVAAARRLGGGGPILCEGGPRLFGSLLAGAVPLDLFLTVAPQLTGRDIASPERLGLVEGVTLPPFSRRATLASVRTAGDHLLLRYAINPA